MRSHQLIIFDSGIGGFSILRHLLNLPVPITYFADQLHFPYGDKSVTWLKSRLTTLARCFARSSPPAVVIACNTGTVSAIDRVRSLLSCPVIGVEPVTKPISLYPDPVIWGTTTTISSARASELKDTHGDHIRYYTPTSLASAIEHDDLPQIHQILSRAHTDLADPSAIGLSCTHYPLIAPLIQEYFPTSVIVDPSPAVASQVKKSLPTTNYHIPATITFLSTQSSVRLKQQSEHYL